MYPKGKQLLYHVTTDDVADTIIDTQFEPGDFGTVGGGVYFAITAEQAKDKATGGSAKAKQKAVPESKENAKKKDPKKDILDRIKGWFKSSEPKQVTLEAQVDVGCLLEINSRQKTDWKAPGDTTPGPGYDWLTSAEENRKKLREIGCDSVGHNLSAVPGLEVCIYDPARLIGDTVKLQEKHWWRIFICDY